VGWLLLLTNTCVPAKNLTKKTRSFQHSSTTSVKFEHMKSTGFRVKMTMHKSSCVTVEIPTLAEKLLWASNVSSQECLIYFSIRETFHDLNRHACCNTCRSVCTMPVSFRL